MFYKFLKITIGTAIRVFFRRIVILGEKNIPADKPLIIVSNHPSAFMDPLVLGSLMERELYFFARADIFSSGFVRWITEKAHMSPIYRIVDGIDSLEKNDVVFAHGYKLLSENKVLLLFGEGVTDEAFVRRVKSMKKGSMRIGLGAENKFDFKLGVNIICAGINYSDPRKFRSDLLLSFSKPIVVKEYRDLFSEHNNKAMLELNKEIYARLKEQVIHIENSENSEIFEQMLILTQKGINNDFYDPAVPLEKRWEYTKRLSEALNKKSAESPGEISILKEKTSEYFKSNSRHRQLTGMPSLTGFAYLLLTLPVFIFGILNNYPPAKLSSFLSRKISQRPVFWSGTDMVFSIITVPVYYFIVVTVFQAGLGFQSALHQFFATLLYLALMPLSGIFAFDYNQRLRFFIEKIKLRKMQGRNMPEEKKLYEMRKSLVTDIEKMAEVFYKPSQK